MCQQAYDFYATVVLLIPTLENEIFHIFSKIKFNENKGTQGSLCLRCLVLPCIPQIAGLLSAGERSGHLMVSDTRHPRPRATPEMQYQDDPILGRDHTAQDTYNT